MFHKTGVAPALHFLIHPVRILTIKNPSLFASGGVARQSYSLDVWMLGFRRGRVALPQPDIR